MAGSGAGWRREGREGGRAAPVTWRVAVLERGEAVERTRARVGLEKRSLVWAPPLPGCPAGRGGSAPSVAPGGGG